MSTAQSQERLVPPYISYQTLQRFVDGLKQGIPARIDRSVMPSLSGQVQTQLLAALRYLGLILLEDGPTDRLVRLVNTEGPERQAVLRETIEAAYPFLSETGFSLSSATPSQLDGKIKEQGAAGDTVRKCVSFLLAAAQNAGMPLSPYFRGKPRGPSATTTTRRTAARRTRSGTQSSPPTTPLAATGEQPTNVSWEQMLLSKFPSFDPAWPDEVKAKWFDAFDKLMGRKPEDR